ncbi:MAG: response regulator transcription factor [Flavobacteriaceae bacterium]|nr:response regulator transcription factor [Flavobacteriaceae bacterium]
MIRTCIIIEDQPPAQRILHKYISDIKHLDLKATFSNAIEAIEFLKTNNVDLIFLDIHLPKISGIDFLKSVPNHPYIILTTAFSEYALESYEYNVIDYLLKPFSFQRFIQAISKLPEVKSNEDNLTSDKTKDTDSILIKSGYDLIKILLKDIIYLKAVTDYIEITTTTKTYLSSYSLKEWISKLNGNVFFRVHKSYIVNTQYLTKISRNTIYLSNIAIPIGRTYKEDFLSRYTES